MNRIFLNFCVIFLVAICITGCKKEQENKDNNKTLENNATSILKPKEKEESQETPLQEQLKKNLKSHLNELSKELQNKNLNHLQLEQNAGMQKHIEHFESLHGRKDIPKGGSAKDDLNQKIQKAYLLQQERIEKLQQKNDDLGK